MHDDLSIQLQLGAHRRIFQACGFSEILSIAGDSDACRIYTIRVFVNLLFFQNS